MKRLLQFVLSNATRSWVQLCANWKTLSHFGERAAFLLPLGLVLVAAEGAVADSNNPFARGCDAFQAGEFAQAAREFRAAVPTCGTLLNLGLTEWRRGRVGPAILAWEQAAWIDPFDARATHNLRYARRVAGVESPDLSWYERASAWLPAGYWAWLVGGGLWLSLGLMILPGAFRWRKPAWTQAVAAVGLAVFLVSLPAQLGLVKRAQIGFVLQKNAPLRLTPTEEAEVVAKLSSGEPGRVLRVRGNYILVQTVKGQGWMEQSQFGLIGSR